MTTKRTLLMRRPKLVITAEMVELFRRGREILAEGSGEDEGPRHREFLDIDKRLNWTLLKRDPHEVSVLDDLRGDPPAYMRARNSAAKPDFNGWFSGRELQRQLQAALDRQASDKITAAK
jgi:hypothetical protein